MKTKTSKLNLHKLDAEGDVMYKSFKKSQISLAFYTGFIFTLMEKFNQ